MEKKNDNFRQEIMNNEIINISEKSKCNFHRNLILQ